MKDLWTRTRTIDKKEELYIINNSGIDRLLFLDTKTSFEGNTELPLGKNQMLG